MGCCVSTSNESSALGPQKHQHSSVGAQRPRSDAIESRAPPPSAEEETVKEVLSETPRPKPPPPVPVLHIPIIKPEEQDYAAEEKRSHKPVFDKIAPEHEEREKKVPISNTVEDASETSEICSLSESVSTTTITKDDDEEVRQRVHRSPLKLPKNRAFSGDLGARRDRVVGKSPTRRSDQSPGRRNGNGVGSVRLVQSREPAHPTSARRAPRTEPHRREPGESSARRSRSPSINRTDGGATRSAVGRSPSARRSGRSPGRAATAPTERSRSATAEESSVEGKWPATTNESLENPLVSLECFIFL